METSQSRDRVTWGRASRGRDDFEEFYRAELARLLALAHALCGPQVADDVAQEAMLAAYRGWKQVGDQQRPDAWVRRRCAQLAVSGSRQRLVELRSAAHLTVHREADGPEVPGETDDAWQRLRALPPRQAQVAALHHVLDLDTAETAATLGLPLDIVESDLGQADAALAGARLQVAAARLHQSLRSLDVEASLDALVGTRRRRGLARVVAVLVVLALVTAGAALLGGSATDDDEPGPDDPSGYGAFVTNRSGNGTAGMVQVDSAGGSETLTALPDGTPLVNPADVEVSPEGDVLALVGDDQLQVVGLGDNATSTSVSCRRCLFVDWMGFKVGILLVTSFDADGAHTHVYANDGIERGALTMPEGVAPSGYSPDRLSMVGVENLGSGATRRSRLFVLDDGTGERTPLDGTETEPGHFIYDAAWSPDGVQVGYLEAGDYGAGGGVAAQDYRLMVASADGTEVHEVADLGRCYCVRMADPRFAWSPDGSSLLAVTVTSKDSTDSSEVRVFGIDGSVERTLPGGAPVDWGPPVP